MLATIVRRVTVHALDAVVERGQRSSRSVVRRAASTIDRLRTTVGLDAVPMRSPMPEWTGIEADEPMWESSRKKRDKWRAEQLGDPSETSSDAVPESPIKVYFKRGCPSTRAALDLLRERELEFESVDVTDDEGTRSWLRTLTGRKTTPQIFIHGESVGGYDELRELDQSGALRQRLQSEDTAAPDERASARGTRRLPVVHPEHSPFESVGEIPEAERGVAGEVLDGQTLIERVQQVIAECRPLVQSDGGDIELLDVHDDVVHLRLTGNCIGCPSSQVTLRQGIERRLKAKIPQIRAIESPQLLPLS